MRMTLTNTGRLMHMLSLRQHVYLELRLNENKYFNECMKTKHKVRNPPRKKLLVFIVDTTYEDYEKLQIQ